MNILILAIDEDFKINDNSYPIILTEFKKSLLIEQQLKKCEYLINPKIIFIISEDICNKWHIDTIIKQLNPTASVLKLHKQTYGSACASLLAIDMINNQEELLIVNSNVFIDIYYNNILYEFKKQNYDAGVVTFPSYHPHYSYIRIDENKVIECSTKKPISNNAIAEFYWFLYGCDFVKSVQKSIKKDTHIDGNFFISSALNELILEQKIIGFYKISSRRYYSFHLKKDQEKKFFISHKG